MSKDESQTTNREHDRAGAFNSTKSGADSRTSKVSGTNSGDSPSEVEKRKNLVGIGAKSMDALAAGELRSAQRIRTNPSSSVVAEQQTRAGSYVKNDEDFDDKASNSSSRREANSKPLICWNCGKEGHIGKHCGEMRRPPRGSRKRDGDSKMATKFYEEHGEALGRADADRELIKELREKVKKSEEKLPMWQIPEQKNRLMDRGLDFEEATAGFDNLPTIKRRYDMRGVVLAFFFSYYACMAWMDRWGCTYMRMFTVTYYYALCAVFFLPVVWALHRVGLYHEKHATLRYRLEERVGEPPVEDQRDINTRGLGILLNDPDLCAFNIHKLKESRWFFDLLPSLFPRLIECKDPLQNEIVQYGVVSLSLFTALRNPKCTTKTDDPKRVLEWMQRFAQMESKINIDRNDEASFGVRAATVEFAFAYTYGFHINSAETISHRFEPNQNDPNWVGPPR